MGCPGPVSHRQFLGWQWWLREEWNRPSRSDHYLMALICEVRRLFAKSPAQIQPRDCQLQFTFDRTADDRKAREKKRQQQIALDKQRWGAFVGRPPPKKLLPQPKDEILLDENDG